MHESQSTAGEYGYPGDQSSQSAGFMSRLKNIFASPSEFNPRPAPKWEWIVAVAVVVLLGMGALAIQRPYLEPDLTRAAKENLERVRDQIPAERYSELERSIEEDMSKNFELSPRTLGIGLLAGLFFTAIIGLYCWMSGNFFLGGKAPFWQVLTIVAFSAFIGLIGGYLRGGLMVMKETSHVSAGLGLLMPNPDGSFLFYLMRQMEFTTIWRIVATCIALGAVYQKKSASFMYLLFPAWLLFISLVALANTFIGGTIVY